MSRSFGAMVEQAMRGDDVIVDRYGSPHVAIIDYARYRRLVEAEQQLLFERLQRSVQAVSARAADLGEDEVENLIDRARTEAFAERENRQAAA